MKIITSDNRSIIISNSLFQSKFNIQIKDIMHIPESFCIIIQLFDMIFHDIYTNNLRVHHLAHELKIKKLIDLFPIYGKYNIEDYIIFYTSVLYSREDVKDRIPT